MARKTDLTPELQAEAVKLAKAGIPKVVIADAIGISRATLFDWLKYGNTDWTPKEGEQCPKDRQPFIEFTDAFTKARAKPIMLCEATWLNAVQKGDAQAAERWLKLHEPSLYRDESTVTVNVGTERALDALAKYNDVFGKVAEDAEDANESA